MNYETMGWGMGFAWIIGLVFIGLLFWLIFSTIQNTIMRKKEVDSAKEILRSRFAKGEISKQKFEEMSKDLN
jgi:putative membrane protein